MIWLDCPMEGLLQRCVLMGDRPLFRDEASFRKLYQERLPYYQQADYRIESSGEPMRVVEQILAKQWFTNLNVQARLIQVENSVLDHEIRAASFPGVAYNNWVPDYGDPMGILTPLFVRDDNDGWTDPRYLALLSEANRTLDPRARFERLARAEERLLHEMPLIPLAFRRSFYLRKPYVHALDPNPFDVHYFRYTWIDTGWKP